MIEFKIRADEAGQRLDKYLAKYLNQAPKSFIYKSLRKKNIKLNGAKAEGNELLKEGDQIRLFFSDETLGTLRTEAARPHLKSTIASAYRDTGLPDLKQGIPGSSVSGFRQGESPAFSLSDYCEIIYEDEHVIIANKRAGILSQKAEADDFSINEALLLYTREQQSASGGRASAAFTPSVCNRLDRNTSGLICFAKTYAAAREWNRLFQEREMKKYYLAVVSGKVREPVHAEGWLLKSKKDNLVRILDRPEQGASRIETAFWPVSPKGLQRIRKESTADQNGAGSESFVADKNLPQGKVSVLESEKAIFSNNDAIKHNNAENHEAAAAGNAACGSHEAFSGQKLHDSPSLGLSLPRGYSLVLVELITGKSHQIRAHLSHLGHPLAGDPKYADPVETARLRKAYGIRRQLLHAYTLELPEDVQSPMEGLRGHHFHAPLPEDMRRLLGIQ